MFNNDLKNKTAIVTGSTTGIGLATALLLAKHGAQVFLNGKDKNILDEVVATHQQGAISIKGIAGDVSDENFVEDLIQRVLNATGRIDILVNNAGMAERRLVSLEEIESELWDAYLDSHLKGAFLLCRAVKPHMEKQKSGKIVNIVSAAALIRMGPAHYIAAKSGLMGLTKSLAHELTPFNIQVNAVAPGLVDTPSSRRNYSTMFFEKMTQYTPAGRIAKPDDIAKAVLFFTSSLSDFVSGQILAVDGGFTLVLE